ncbi:MAG: lytic transglycosylase domain-containing protein [Conexibacter sp.]
MRRRSAARRRAARRRAFLLLAFLAVVGLGAALLHPLFTSAVRDLALPLRHESAIREQANDKRLDPALIAGVIYAESKFSDSTSSAGALGLMQLLPSTAHFIAQRTGGTRFTTEDLSTPEINIAYGSWYLRYLLDRYGGNEVLALAAYNGGETNVSRWLADTHARGERFGLDDIPFAETRAYVERVLKARSDYAATYPDELGIG